MSGESKRLPSDGRKRNGCIPFFPSFHSLFRRKGFADHDIVDAPSDAAEAASRTQTPPRVTFGEVCSHVLIKYA